MKTSIPHRKFALRGIALALAGFGSLAMLAQPRPGNSKQPSPPPPARQQPVSRPAPAPAPRPVVVPRNYTPVRYNNVDYYTHRGMFYQNTPRGYVVVRPPVGLRIATLPFGFARVILNGGIFYRYNDIYYQAVAGGGYIVVNTPPGIIVTTPPPVVVQQQPDVVAAPAPVVAAAVNYQSVWVGNTELKFRDGQFFRQASDGSLIWVPAPVGAITPSLPSDSTSVWFQDVEYLDCDGVYFRKTPSGYAVVTPPWNDTAPGQ
jgi:hypothetical protein